MSTKVVYAAAAAYFLAPLETFPCVFFSFFAKPSSQCPPFFPFLFFSFYHSELLRQINLESWEGSIWKAKSKITWQNTFTASAFAVAVSLICVDGRVSFNSQTACETVGAILISALGQASFGKFCCCCCCPFEYLFMLVFVLVCVLINKTLGL